MLPTPKRQTLPEINLNFDQFIEALERNDRGLPEHIALSGAVDCPRPQQISSLAKALKINSRLKTLIIDNGLYARMSNGLRWDSSVGDQGAVELANALTYNKTLTSLTLKATNIGTVGAQSLAHALQVNSSLNELCLPMNPIPDEGIQALAQVLQTNETLIKLNLDIMPASEQAIVTTMLTPTISYLDEETIQALATALQHNTMLKELILPENCATSGIVLQLADALKGNTTLINLQAGHRWNIGHQQNTTNIPENVQRADAVLGPLLQRNRRITKQRIQRFGDPVLASAIVNDAFYLLLKVVVLSLFKRTGIEYLEGFPLDVWAHILNLATPDCIQLDEPLLSDWCHKMAQIYIEVQLSAYIKNDSKHEPRVTALLAKIMSTKNLAELMEVLRKQQLVLDGENPYPLIEQLTGLIPFHPNKYKTDVQTPFAPGERYPDIIGFWSRAPRVNEPLQLEAASGPDAVPNSQPPTTASTEQANPDESTENVEATTPQEVSTEDVETPRETPQMAHR